MKCLNIYIIIVFHLRSILNKITCILYNDRYFKKKTFDINFLDYTNGTTKNTDVNVAINNVLGHLCFLNKLILRLMLNNQMAVSSLAGL